PPFGFPRIGSATVNVVPGVDNFVVISFPAAGAIVGRVLDETGTNPVTQVNVALPQENGFSYVPVDNQGHFAFEGLALKHYKLSAPAPITFSNDVTGILNTLANTNASADAVQAAIGEAFAIFTGAADPFLNGSGASFNPNRWGF